MRRAVNAELVQPSVRSGNTGDGDRIVGLHGDRGIFRHCNAFRTVDADRVAAELRAADREIQRLIQRLKRSGSRDRLCGHGEAAVSSDCDGRRVRENIGACHEPVARVRNRRQRDRVAGVSSLSRCDGAMLDVLRNADGIAGLKDRCNRDVRFRHRKGASILIDRDRTAPRIDCRDRDKTAVFIRRHRQGDGISDVGFFGRGNAAVFAVIDGDPEPRLAVDRRDRYIGSRHHKAVRLLVKCNVVVPRVLDRECREEAVLVVRRKGQGHGIAVVRRSAVRCHSAKPARVDGHGIIDLS